ncbi:uncharacterized protein LOC122499033 [Leptopilina heterotoma]|uniref:uncharacterized protein LOC122499033 n=1 Tax=Leptopilina heterotoma TaxID=63436 RepID=UPI001CA9ABDE|nr:uncharacterized protein LOC122499033 [Leptopilina heterotoma]
MGSTNGLVCKLVTFIFHWSNLMKILCTCFRGIFRPNAVQHLISDIIKLEKNIREIKRRKNDRNNSLYRGLMFVNAWFPIIVCVIYAVDLNGNPEIRIGEIFQIINRVGLVVMHSSFCTFTLIIYLQLRETNKQYKRLRNSHLSLAHRIWGLKVAVWRHCTITKAWNQLIDVYESYLFFEMISMTAATLGSLYYVYSYFAPGRYLEYNFLPLREILLVVQAIYEIMIICKLCDSIVNESCKRGIMSEEAKLKTTPLFLMESPSGFKGVKLQRLSCKLYGHFTLNNSLLIMVCLCLLSYGIFFSLKIIGNLGEFLALQNLL